MANSDLLFETEFNYRAYKTALESGLTSSQYYMLQEAGLGDMGKKVLDFFKKKLGSDEKSAADTKKAKEVLQKSIDKIISEFPDKESGEKFVKALLKSYLETGKLPELGDSGGEKTSGGEGQGQVQAGKAPATDRSKAESSPAAQTDTGAMVSAMAGELAGVDGQQAVAKAQKDNVPFDKAYKALVNKVAEASEEDVPTVKKVLDWLLDNDKIIPTTKVTFGESIASENLDNLIYEKWLKMAGVPDNLIVEVNEGTQVILENLFEAEPAPATVPAKGNKTPKAGKTNTKASAGGAKTTPGTTTGKPKTGKSKAAGNSQPAAQPAASQDAKKKASKGKPSKPGKHAALASLINKQIQVSVKVVEPILNALVTKAKVKLAN